MNIDLNIQGRKYILTPLPHRQLLPSLTQGLSVHALLPQIVQFSAGLVQVHVHVHVHHSAGRVMVEVGCDLVKGLAACLWHPEKREDEEEK